MTEQTAGSLEWRLTLLERENRRLKRFGAAGLLGIAAIVLMGQAGGGSRTVEAERFLLKDGAGNVRAGLIMDSDVPRLYFTDSSGRTRAAFGVVAGVGMLSFVDTNSTLRTTITESILNFRDLHGKRRLQMGGDVDATGLLLLDSNERHRFKVAVDGGLPRLALADATENTRVFVGVDTDGAAKVAVSDEHGRGGGRLMLDKDGPRLDFLDPNGIGRAKVHLTSDGPLLAVTDPSGRGYAVVGYVAGGPVIRLVDSTDREVFSKP